MKICRSIPTFESRRYINKTARRNRKLEMYQLAAGPFCGSVVSGALLAGYLKFIGISDTASAVLMQLLVCAASIQCIAPLIYMNTRKRITIVRWLYGGWRLLCVTVIFSMFIKNPNMKVWVFAVLYLAAFLCAYLAEPALCEHLTNVAPRKMRGRFYGKRDAVSIAATAGSGMILGAILDFFRGREMEAAGFVVLYIIAAVGAIVQVACLFRVKEMPIRKPPRAPVPLMKRLAEPVLDRRFRQMIGFSVIYNIGVYVANSYFAIYMVSVLQLGYTYIAAMSVLSTVIRIIAANRWGKLGDRKNHGVVLLVSLLLLVVCHMTHALATPENYRIVLPIANILSGVAWGGLAVGVTNTMFQHANLKHMTTYAGVHGGIASLSGFLAALAGAAIASRMLDLKLCFFGLPITYMQVMFVISAAILLLAAVYAWLVLLKQRGEAEPPRKG